MKIKNSQEIGGKQDFSKTGLKQVEGKLVCKEKLNIVGLNYPKWTRRKWGNVSISDIL